MASAIAPSLEVLLRSDPAAVAAAVDGGALELRATIKALTAINEALERRAFELDCADGNIFCWAAPGCKRDNDVDHDSNMSSRTERGTVCVGAGRFEIEVCLENENVEGDETFSVECAVFSCEGGGAFHVDLEEAEKALVEGRVERFSRADDDEEATEDTVTYSIAAPTATRAAAVRSFVLAFANWLVEELGGEDEYGVGLGWRVSDVAVALGKNKKKVRKA